MIFEELTFEEMFDKVRFSLLNPCKNKNWRVLKSHLGGAQITLPAAPVLGWVEFLLNWTWS